MEQSTIFVEVPSNSHVKTKELLSELLLILPNSKEWSENIELGESDVSIKIHEDIGPQFLIFTTKESQFVFKIIEYRSRASLGIDSVIKKENHQLVLTNFNTDLGLKVADLFMSTFPINLESNQVVNFTVHKDFIFFRMYRFCVVEKGPIFEKIGPHLTLRIWRMAEYVGNDKKTFNYQKYIKNSNLL
jgi:ribosome production factor 1